MWTKFILELVCMIPWPSLLIKEIIKALSTKKQENVLSMFQKGCRHQEIAKVLNVSIESLYNIRTTYLLNVNCSSRGRPRILNIEME